MKYYMIPFLVSVCLLTGCQRNARQDTNQTIKPNVIFILADDLGYGDVHTLNPDSRIPTPNMDRLALEGITFTDAHSGSGVCTPTRYGVLTGRYAWRSRLKRGVLNGYSKHLIDPDRTTVADIFKKAGYITACFGKWHLGMDMPLLEGTENKLHKLDSSKHIQNSPIEYGFDYFYGISASLDFPPYVYIENDRFTEATSDSLPKTPFPTYARRGERAPGFKLVESLDIITSKAVEFMEERAQQSFFLYLPLTAPHKPVLPHERFRGNTQLGHYGDFVTQVDWTVGQILDKLDQLEIADNTLVILTSDNGSFMKRIGEDSNHPSGSPGHVKDETIQAFDPANHRSNYIFRGTKADIWEGGHHVPFLLRWPDVVQKASQNDQSICLTDFFSTAADITGHNPDRSSEGEDSFSILPLLKKERGYSREAVIHHSSAGMFAIRKGKWKLVLGNGSGGRQAPRGKAFEGPYQLFDMQADQVESQDVASENPGIVEDLLKDFDTIYERTEAARPDKSSRR